jgi:hypothetical protein
MEQNSVSDRVQLTHGLNGVGKKVLKWKDLVTGVKYIYY